MEPSRTSINSALITNPRIMCLSIILVISGTIDTLGVKYLIDQKHFNYRHPVFVNVGMFLGEYLNYLIWMLCFCSPSWSKQHLLENSQIVGIQSDSSKKTKT